MTKEISINKVDKSFAIMFDSFSNKKDSFKIKLLQDWQDLVFDEKTNTFRDSVDYKGSFKISFKDGSSDVNFILSNIKPLLKKTEKLDTYSLDRIKEHYSENDIFTMSFNYDDIIKSA